MLDKPFSLQLFSSASVYACSFSVFSMSHLKPSDRIAKVQLKVHSQSVSAENAPAGAPWNSQPLNSLTQAKDMHFCTPSVLQSTSDSICAEMQVSKQKAFLNYTLLLAAVKLHLPHCSYVPFFSHVCAVTGLTLSSLANIQQLLS